MVEKIEMEKKVLELDEIRLVGFRVLCSGDKYIEEIPKASQKLSERLNEIKQVVNPLLQYGAFVVENQTAEEDGYWVTVQVKEYIDIPNDMVKLTVPSQRYAVLRHKGANHQIMNSYEELHKWIDENNYLRLKEKWHLERFYSWKDSKNLDVELLDTIK